VVELNIPKWRTFLDAEEVLDAPPDGYYSVAQIAKALNLSPSRTGQMLLKKEREGLTDTVWVRQGRHKAKYYKMKEEA